MIIWGSFNINIYLFNYLFVYLFIKIYLFYLFIYLFIYLLNLFIYLFIYLLNYLIHNISPVSLCSVKACHLIKLAPVNLSPEVFY